jgi:hypothetical protein
VDLLSGYNREYSMSTLAKADEAKSKYLYR